MHKLIIASTTTPQISATLHKTVTSTSHRSYAIHVHIFDVGETKRLGRRH